jgi:hypothetical protein
MSHYPQTLADVLPESKRFFEIAKNRQITTRKAEFTHDGWWTAGYGLRATVGDPEAAAVMFGATPDSEEDIALAEEACSGMLEYAEANGITVPAPKFSAGPVGKINWKKVLEIFLMIAPLFLEQTPTV